MSDLAAFERVLAHTRLRVRGFRSLRGLALGSALALTTAALLQRLAQHGLGVAPASARGWLGLGALALLPGLLGALLPMARSVTARLLDRSHGFPDAARSTVEFLGLPAAERTPFMAAHLRDVAHRATGWSAARAVPYRRPPELAVCLAVPLLAWSLVWLLPSATSRPPEPASQRIERRANRVLSQEDLAAFKSELRSLTEAARPLVPEVARELEALNRVLEGLATGALSREEGVRALLALERKLHLGPAEAGDADARTLSELAADLGRAASHQPLTKALKDNDPAAAAMALRALARASTQAPEEREKLAAALSRERERLRAEEAQEERVRELEGLLRKPREPGTEGAAERSLFERNKRELERLRREQGQRRERHRELSRLSRDLADASGALDRNADAEAQRALEEAASDLERFADARHGAQQQRELEQQVAQLREQLQRQAPNQAAQGGGEQGGGAGERQARTQRFVLRAQGKREGEQQEHRLSLQPGNAQSGGGKSDGAAGQPGPPQPGQGQPAQPQGAPPGERAAPGQPGQPGQGQAGEQQLVLEPGGTGQGQGQAELLLPGQRVPMPGPGAGGGSEGGNEADPSLLAPPAKPLNAQHADSAVAGTLGRGPTRSQIILDAADRGFAEAPYRKVYGDYRDHAESVIARDEVPPGYRFYVRRYFQLIRPRDEQGPTP
jgi:hypothetical protein